MHERVHNLCALSVRMGLNSIIISLEWVFNQVCRIMSVGCQAYVDIWLKFRNIFRILKTRVHFTFYNPAQQPAIHVHLCTNTKHTLAILYLGIKGFQKCC